MNKIQWRRKGEQGGLELFVEEDGVWNHYSTSKIKQPDLTLPGASRGFTTMQAALKAGYQYLDVDGNPVD